MTLPVFLSASEPYNTRAREYWDSRNLLYAREAVRTLTAHVLPHWPLVFGGHPTITPLVRAIRGHILDAARRRDPKTVVQPKIVIFQSRLYVPATEDSDVVLTDSHKREGEKADPGTGWRNASLLRMRYEMLAQPDPELIHPMFRDQRRIGAERKRRTGSLDFAAAFFIGGMEGVEREFRIFRTFHPRTPAYPIASTGAAARLLFTQMDWTGPSRLPDRLVGDTAYSLLFEHLLPLPGDRPAIDSIERGFAPPKRYPPDAYLDPPELDRETSGPPAPLAR
jgi:hypothetical protein